jgi:hypothetical protein
VAVGRRPEPEPGTRRGEARADPTDRRSQVNAGTQAQSTPQEKDDLRELPNPSPGARPQRRCSSILFDCPVSVCSLPDGRR